MAVQRAGPSRSGAPDPRSGDDGRCRGSPAGLQRAHLFSAQRLVIDLPDLVRQQAVALAGASVFAYLALLVVPLVFNITPAPIVVSDLCMLMVIMGVVRLAYLIAASTGSTISLIGAMIAPRAPWRTAAPRR